MTDNEQRKGDAWIGQTYIELIIFRIQVHRPSSLSVVEASAPEGEKSAAQVLLVWLLSVHSTVCCSMLDAAETAGTEAIAPLS